MSTTEFTSDLGVRQTIGTVLSAEIPGGGVTVQTEAGVGRATTAVSCLVEPEAGDRVLLAGADPEEQFILAVLARPGDSPLRVRTDRDLSIGVGKGRLSLAAGDGIDLLSPKEISLSTGRLRVRAEEGHVLVERLRHVGSQVISQARRIKVVSDIIDAVAERMTQRSKRSYRYVSEQDVVRSHEIDYRAEENVNLRGKNALIITRRLVKMDGSQIHLG